MFDGPYTDLQPAAPGIAVRLPDSCLMHSSHTAVLNLPSLPIAARTAHIFPALASGSLLSIGLLCDHGCHATFTATTVTVTHHGVIIATGARSHTTNGLWRIHLPAPDQPLDLHPATTSPHPTGATANSVIRHDTVAERIAFYHACMFSPALSTWCAAIDAGRLTTWPDLTFAQVRQHPPQSTPMAKGHLDQKRANAQSTKLPDPPMDPSLAQPGETPLESCPPTTDPPAIRTHFVYADCHPVTGQVYSDQTGRFLQASTTGNVYIVVLYDYDSNSIHAEPM